MEAYSGLLGAESVPSYFIYFTVDPASVDVNIHPTKTEIKFQNESVFSNPVGVCAGGFGEVQYYAASGF